MMPVRFVGATFVSGVLSLAALAVSFGAGTAAAEPDVNAIVNSTCTYPQVMAALTAQDPDVANQVSTSPLATTWLQNLVAAPPEQRRGMIDQAQGMPQVQQYTGLISQVANTCKNF